MKASLDDLAPSFVSVRSSLFLDMDSGGLLMSSGLPPGFRFHPTDQELISCYLNKKMAACLPPDWNIIADIDLYKFNPWDLPEKAFFGEGEWFFFSPRDRKYPNGVRPNRSAGSGYWKATGTDKPILVAGGTRCIGVKKALVFYKGRPPKGVKTDWVMHEYRLLDSVVSPSQSQKQKGSMRLDDWVLCRVKQKGNLPAASVDAFDNTTPTQSVLTLGAQSEEKPKVELERIDLSEWGEHQNLGYLLLSQEGRQTTGNHSETDCFMTYSYFAAGNTEALQWPSPTVFGSMKRKASFGVLDEPMLLQPGKRLQCAADGLLSSVDSAAVSQGFPEFFT
ncbi:hypothetical protein HPP92_002941 [Vanilla planifolia]|uniref:NAC domain-containing protein n=1 Tax=Vanilla planifolia TaxID=51239 RepID=A0A835VIG9_VANPL|nr:hypothetical protein HPP92_002941 [Vanilla planifolia]